MKSRALLLAGLFPMFLALAAYSVSWSFIWDEGFHLIAAQLIAEGKRPYIDFCFPQTPLNAYFNAGLLLAFGNHWKPIHLASAVYVSVAVWLVADFIQTRLMAERWRTPCAVAASVLFGLNLIVVQFGLAAQAYGIGMMWNAAAFRAALPAIRSRRLWFALLAGLCAGSAAASTLLTAPVPLVLLAWIIFCNEEGSRFVKAAAYLVASALPFTPVVWLYLQGPKQTLFNVLQYQTLFRRTNWGDANMHDLDALTDWLNSPQDLLLIGLVAVALVSIFRDRSSAWLSTWKEFLLAAALALALVLFISTAHPTFERYYVVAMPFVAIVAAFGLYVAGSRLATPSRPWLVCGLTVALAYCMFFRDLLDEKDDNHWSGYEEVARAIKEVTPIAASLYTDEIIYFLLQQDPPSGLEFSYAERLNLPPDQEKLFHVISIKKVREEIQSGHFATVATCRERAVDELKPAPYFKQHTEPDECDLFWQPNGKVPEPDDNSPADNGSAGKNSAHKR